LFLPRQTLDIDHTCNHNSLLASLTDSQYLISFIFLSYWAIRRLVRRPHKLESEYTRSNFSTSPWCNPLHFTQNIAIVPPTQYRWSLAWYSSSILPLVRWPHPHIQSRWYLAVPFMVLNKRIKIVLVLPLLVPHTDSLYLLLNCSISYVSVLHASCRSCITWQSDAWR
jgi:hypothetical protein